MRRRRSGTSSRSSRRSRSGRRPTPTNGLEGLRLRPARSGDLATLVEHRRRMFREIGRWSNSALARNAKEYRRWVRRERAAHRFFGFVVEEPGTGIAGSGAVWLQPAQPRPAPLAGPFLPYLMSMFTEPRYRGRGVASALVSRMVEWAEARGYRRIVLHASRKGRSVYERLGFEATNEMRLALPRTGVPLQGNRDRARRRAP